MIGDIFELNNLKNQRCDLKHARDLVYVYTGSPQDLSYRVTVASTSNMQGADTVILKSLVVGPLVLIW